MEPSDALEHLPGMRASIVISLIFVSGSSTLAQAEAVPHCFGEEATVLGTSGDDELEGTDGRDVIVGLEGDDWIRGADGGDLICAGEGDDRVAAGAGDDRVTGGRGFDRLRGGEGDDLLTDRSGRVYGDAGDDTIRAGSVEGGTGHDAIEVPTRYGRVRGGYGDDRISILRPDGLVTVVYLGSPNPVSVDLRSGIATGWGTDRLVGVRSILGSAGDDLLIGSDRDDDLHGSDGNDEIRGGRGADHLTSGIGNDSLFGGRGADRIFTHARQEDRAVVQAGRGRDRIIAGLGVQDHRGGHGFDHIAFIYSGTCTDIPGDQEGMRIELFADPRKPDTARSELLDATFSGFESVMGTCGEDLILGSPNADVLHGGRGDDEIYGRGGGDLLKGGRDDDSLYGGRGNDDLDGGSQFLGGGDDHHGGAGNDRCRTDGQTDTYESCEEMYESRFLGRELVDS